MRKATRATSRAGSEMGSDETRAKLSSLFLREFSPEALAGVKLNKGATALFVVEVCRVLRLAADSAELKTVTPLLDKVCYAAYAECFPPGPSLKNVALGFGEEFWRNLLARLAEEVGCRYPQGSAKDAAAEDKSSSIGTGIT